MGHTVFVVCGRKKMETKTKQLAEKGNRMGLSGENLNQNIEESNYGLTMYSPTHYYSADIENRKKILTTDAFITGIGTTLRRKLRKHQTVESSKLLLEVTS